MAKHSATFYFTLKTNKRNKSGLASLYYTIQVNSMKTGFTTGKLVDPSLWVANKQMIKGDTEETRLLNEYMNLLKLKTFSKENELMERGFVVTADLLRDAVLDKIPSLNESTLGSILLDYIETRRGVVGKKLSSSTFYVFTHASEMLQVFLQETYRRKDIHLYEVNMRFMERWHGFLLKRMCHNTATKYLTFMKSLMLYAMSNGYAQNNLIASYIVQRDPVEIDFLDDIELTKFMNYDSTLPRMITARDMFLFGCFTGLSYSDIRGLTVEHLYFDSEHRLWIKKKRQKTGVLSRIPVIPQAKEIMVKYAVQNLGSYDFHFVPLQDLADINKNIKKIAKTCGITKKITFHTSRHTFATTVTLANHISIEVVSKMLGHTNTKMTAHYAKIIDRSIAEQMDGLIKGNLLPQRRAEIEEAVEI